MSILKDLILISIYSISFWILYNNLDEVVTLSIFLIVVSCIAIYYRKLYLDTNYKFTQRTNFFTEILLHDLKTPILAQLRALELLYKEKVGIMNDTQKELVLQSENSCKCVLSLISMLLKTYNFENGKSKFYYETFSLSELLNECINELFVLQEEKNVKIVCTTPICETKIRADKADIKTVILNLLTNAIMHSKCNEPINANINITVNKIELEIIGNGSILSEKECLQMFDNSQPFIHSYTTIGNRLGLYLSKKIIEGHKGEIFVQKDGNEFNRFIFTLPMAQNDNYVMPVSPCSLY